MTVNGDRVEILDFARKRDLADLVRHHGPVDRNHVITVAGIHNLGITNNHRIVTRAEGDGVVAGA